MHPYVVTAVREKDSATKTLHWRHRQQLLESLHPDSNNNQEGTNPTHKGVMGYLPGSHILAIIQLHFEKTPNQTEKCCQYLFGYSVLCWLCEEVNGVAINWTCSMLKNIDMMSQLSSMTDELARNSVWVDCSNRWTRMSVGLEMKKWLVVSSSWGRTSRRSESRLASQRKWLNVCVYM